MLESNIWGKIRVLFVSQMVNLRHTSPCLFFPSWLLFLFFFFYVAEEIYVYWSCEDFLCILLQVFWCEAFTFMFMIHFELIFLCNVSYVLKVACLLSKWYLMIQALFVEKIVLMHWIAFALLLKTNCPCILSVSGIAVLFYWSMYLPLWQ